MTKKKELRFVRAFRDKRKIKRIIEDVLSGYGYKAVYGLSEYPKEYRAYLYDNDLLLELYSNYIDKSWAFVVGGERSSESVVLGSEVEVTPKILHKLYVAVFVVPDKGRCLHQFCLENDLLGQLEIWLDGTAEAFARYLLPTWEFKIVRLIRDDIEHIEERVSIALYNRDTKVVKSLGKLVEAFDCYACSPGKEALDAIRDIAITQRL